MNKLTAVFMAAAAFFAGIIVGQFMGASGSFGCNNGNTTVNNYGKVPEDTEDCSGEDSEEDYSF
ncbi:MAG: hypothetical protein ACI4J7_10030 [Ruminiclostridium sp.]